MFISYTFDIETDGLLDNLTHIKCLNVIDNETGEERRYTDDEYYYDAVTGDKTEERTPRHGTIKDGVNLLAACDEICGHNVVGFDIPAIRIVYPEFLPPRVFDTQVISRLVYTDIIERDTIATRKGKLDLPGKLKFKRHSLAAWGLRLGEELKDDFVPSNFNPRFSWNEYPFSKECDDYCMQDVRVNVTLVQHMKKRLEEMGGWDEAVQLEHDVNRILARQMQHGWLYDIEAAEKLTAELQKEVLTLEDKLRETFAPFYKRDGKVKCFKKSMRRKVRGKDYKEWCSGEYQPIKLTAFNPGSRDHIADRLMKQFGWEPDEFTPEGKPKVDETTLGKLDYPEAKLCVEYFKVSKMLGQVSDGDKSQMKLVGKDGRMHGYVCHNGAVTGRMTHSGPNVAQTDKDPRVRSLYIVPPGKKLVGCDADGLEGRCKSHYLARFDKGAFIRTILEGRKEDGTDLHSRNRDAVGLRSRDNAKTIYYAWMYGAGDPKLGSTVYDDWPDDKKARFNAKFQGQARIRQLALIGRKARAKLVSGITGMEALIKAVKDKAKSPGYVRGLDGRRIVIRSQHAALNTLLQGAGAIIMKKALVLLDDSLQARGLVPGADYEFVGNIHDELQIEVNDEHAPTVGKLAADSIEAAGKHFEFRCPLAGNYDIGDNWSQTH